MTMVYDLGGNKFGNLIVKVDYTTWIPWVLDYHMAFVLKVQVVHYWLRLLLSSFLFDVLAQHGGFCLLVFKAVGVKASEDM